VNVKIKDILESLLKESIDIRLVAGSEGLGKFINKQEINRPGLALAGFYNYFAFDRIQIFGLGEYAYINSLEDEILRVILDKFFSYDLNCLFFTHDNNPPQKIFDYSENHSIPTFVVDLPTSQFTRIISTILEDKFAPVTTMHGVLIEVFGVGIILYGKSGVGKSEIALELVERGHRLVADDLIYIKLFQNHNLRGYGSEIIKYHMEIRGLGIINVKDIFGAGAVREFQRVDLVITLEEWQGGKEYERLGLDEHAFNILGEKVPHLLIPVHASRNLAIIVETAAMNHRLKKMGYSPVDEVNRKLNDHMKFSS
jgi:HPr kinase/phosphorylase